ncbi:alpha/beta hydrolase [Streptoverticillium reticulum]|uniref:alpha/beta hydrolase n=1 Tax=Streptoverticillium reticulum TaxID=1433415 RepID=UPI0039BF3BA8
MISQKNRPRRLRRALATAAVVTAIAVPTAAAAEAPASVPAPMPAAFSPADGPATRYAANRATITEAARMADAHGDHGRASRLRAFADPARHFLSFDARGGGRAVEVLGDLPAADRIAVLVPGADTTLDTYDTRGGTPYKTLGGSAAALRDELRRQDPAARVAVVAWLGYATPGTVSPEVLTTGRADEAARELRAFTGSLHRINKNAAISLLGHSYGSVVCGRAASGLAVADIALYGSPGTGADSAAALHTPGRVWAGRGTDDWVGGVPHTSAHLFGTTVGFGADPVSPAFGARVFAAGDGGHSEYHKPGSLPLRNLARIALGKEPVERSHG